MARNDKSSSYTSEIKEMGSGIIIIDHNFNVLYSNERAKSMIGDITGKPCYSFNPENQNKPCTGCPCIELFNGGKLAKKSVHIMNTGDTSETWLEVVATPVKDEEGAIVGAVEVIYDVTALKKANDELDTLKGCTQQILNALPEMIISLNKQGFVTGWNKAAERITGYRQSEMLGKNLFIPAEGLGQLSNVLRHSLSETGPLFHEISITTKDSVEKSLVCSTSAIRDKDDTIIGVFMIAKDARSKPTLRKELSEGTTYFIQEKDKDKALDVFDNLVAKGYQGIFVTRDDSAFSMRNGNTEVLWLASTQNKGFPAATECSQIMTWLDKHITNNHKSVVFLDRADYLVTLHGFDSFLKIIYTISDKVVQTENMAMINVNPAAFNEQQLSLIRQELKSPPFSDRIKVNLSRRQIDLLRMTYNKGLYCKKVYFKDISKEFSISKITTNKLVTSLADIGLLRIKKTGRVKIVELTDRGIDLLKS